jgi:hypothetical protein
MSSFEAFTAQSPTLDDKDANRSDIKDEGPCGFENVSIWSVSFKSEKL